MNKNQETKRLSQSSQEFKNRTQKLRIFGYKMIHDSYVLNFSVFIASIRIYEVQTFSNNDFNGLFEAVSEREKEYNLKLLK